MSHWFSFRWQKHAIALSNVHPLYFPVRFCKRVQTIFITVKNSITIFGAEVPYRMQHRCTYLAKNPWSKSRPIALQHVTNWSIFVHLFSSAGKNILFKTIYLYSRVLADFCKFHWTSNVYATLTMRNRFLGVQISSIWVVFAIKTVTLLWQPVKSWNIASECLSSTDICCWNLLISHCDYQRISADLKHKHFVPDTRAVYWHKNHVYNYACGCGIQSMRVWNPQL